MSHRFRALEDLETELARVTAAPASSRRRPGRRAGRLVTVLAGISVLLAASTIALAATGIILTGPSVPPTRGLAPYAGAGLPLPGQSRLLPLSVPDPAGGLPWGMRVVQTTRGLVCVQIGRVQNGRLGEIGIDGAFHDDGRFHPVGPGVLPRYAGGASEGGITSERGSCVLADGDVTGEGEAWGSAVAAEFTGVSENAAFARARRPGPQRTLRNIAFGILGPHAVSVTYREGSAVRTEHVAAGVGAYLIVQPAASSAASFGAGSAPGTDTPGEGPGTSGVLTVITYDDHGRICENGYDAENGHTEKVSRPCPRPNPYPKSLHVTPAGSFVRHPTVALRVSHGEVLGADISFSAPFAVTSAAEGYTAEIRFCPGGTTGGGGGVLDHNVAQGATVHLTMSDPFQARCNRRAAQIEVIYDSSGPDSKRSYGRTPGELLVGTVTVRLPAGDRPAPTPQIRRP